MKEEPKYDLWDPYCPNCKKVLRREYCVGRHSSQIYECLWCGYRVVRVGTNKMIIKIKGKK